MSFKLDPDGTLPRLPNYITLAEAAERLGFSRQHMHRLAAAGRFQSLKRVGNAHTFVVAETEVALEKQLRAEQAENRAVSG